MANIPNYVTVEQALELIPAGSQIVLQSACAEPQTLLKALIDGVKADVPNLQNLTVCALTYRAAKAPPPPYAELELLRSGRLHFKSFFPHNVLREASRAGLVDYIPMSFYNVPALIRNGFLKADVAMLTVSPPNADGLCSLGTSTDYAEALLDSAALIIAEVNAQCPVTSSRLVPLDRFHALVETNTPLIEVPPLRAEALERQVAANVAEFIKDGATLQFGVGTIPEALIELLPQHHDLGLHGGAMSDGVVDLIQSGAVTNARKPFDTGQSVTALLIGTCRLFDFAHHNPTLRLKPLNYTNNTAIMGQLPDFISINSAIEVDYWGQVNAEMVGDWQLAGVGGQLDFVMGAWAAEGTSIIALPSVSSNGKPRIVPHLEQRMSVTTPRHLAQVIITEKGVADLRGKSLSEREKLLKSIG